MGQIKRFWVQIESENLSIKMMQKSMQKIELVEF